MRIEERVTQLEEKVAELEGRVQAQLGAQTAEEIIRQQIKLLADVQYKAMIRGNYDTVLQIAVEITRMTTLAPQSVRC